MAVGAPGPDPRAAAPGRVASLTARRSWAPAEAACQCRWLSAGKPPADSEPETGRALPNLTRPWTRSESESDQLRLSPSWTCRVRRTGIRRMRQRAAHSHWHSNPGAPQGQGWFVSLY